MGCPQPKSVWGQSCRGGVHSAPGGPTDGRIGGVRGGLFELGVAGDLCGQHPSVRGDGDRRLHSRGRYPVNASETETVLARTTLIAVSRPPETVVVKAKAPQRSDSCREPSPVCTRDRPLNAIKGNREGTGLWRVAITRPDHTDGHLGLGQSSAAARCSSAGYSGRWRRPRRRSCAPSAAW